MNIKTKQKYERIKNLTNIKNTDDIERFINRSVGYFNKIIETKQRIDKGHIQNYFFILEEMINSQNENLPLIYYLSNNKIIFEYGLTILKMRYKNNYSYTDIVKELKKRYKKNISRTTIYRFVNQNQHWEEFYE